MYTGLKKCVCVWLFLTRIMGEGLTNDSAAVFFFFFFPPMAVWSCTPIQSHSYAKDLSTVAQQAEMTVDEHDPPPLPNCMWAHFPDGFPRYAWVKVYACSL